ncbi:hypothetical protein AAFF_G00186970 [Aldrovandia affinis]|uniref:Uncharacterized protein n=1 Tax=Aldrovandia affinis TaxID=143900 RepID=A0AAD7SY05_9TELE|nr:hypothetical protein AAFF_G00186970 [Aldrovandia affinis]
MFEYDLQNANTHETAAVPCLILTSGNRRPVRPASRAEFLRCEWTERADRKCPATAASRFHHRSLRSCALWMRDLSRTARFNRS